MRYVYLYLRVSNRVQNSFERQQQNIIQWLNSRQEIGEYEIKGTYLDHGRSAYKGHHLKYGMKDILDDIEKGVIPKDSVIIAEAVDRFSRQGIKIGEDTINKILDHNIWVGCVRQNILANPNIEERAGNLETKLSLIIALKLAYEESSQKSERIRRTFQIKKENGYITSDFPRWLLLSDDRTTFSVNSTHSITLQKIFDLRLQGYGSHRISVFLNENITLYPCFTSRKQWSKRIVEKYLSMPQVFGQFKDIDDYYPSVIPKTTFIKAQNIELKKGRVSNNNTVTNTINLFKGLFVCGVCGSSCYVSKQQRARTKLICKGRVYQKNECININKYYDDVETLLIKWLQSDINHYFTDTHKTNENETILLKDRISSLTQQRENVTQAIQHATDGSSVNILVDRLQEVTALFKEAEEQLSKLSSSSGVIDVLKDDVDLSCNETRNKYSVRISKIIQHIVIRCDDYTKRDFDFLSVQLTNNKLVKVEKDGDSVLDDAILTNESRGFSIKTLLQDNYSYKKGELVATPLSKLISQN